MNKTSIINKQVMSMRQIVLMLMLMMVGSMSAQEVEAVDSLDLETGIIYHPDGTQEVDSCRDTVSCSTAPSIPQIPFGELDSLTMRSLDDRYAVVWKGGKCGVYDFLKEENVTRIEYSFLRLSFRKELEGAYYTYFAWDEEDKYGVVGISEQTNEFIAISFPRENKEEERQ